MHRARLIISLTVAVACGLPLVAPAMAASGSPHRGSSAPQIIGGETASFGTFGMMAAIIYQLSGNESEFCSGTLLSSNVVLTAGHCGENTSTRVTDTAADFTVVTGNVDWADPIGRQVSKVSEVLVDPEFDPSTLQNDATLLVLSTPTTAQTVQLASSPADASLLLPGDEETVVGWGKTYDAQDGPTDDLQYADTVVQNSGYCAEHAASNFGFDSSTQLCVIDPPTFSDGQCEGDSGGPLLADTDGTPVEVGIISFGATNCDTTSPGYLTRADAISGWADAAVQAVAPPAAAPTPAPTPTPPTPPGPAPVAKPEGGVYRGRTSQHLPLMLRISAGGAKVTRTQFTFRLHCTLRRPPRYRYRAVVSWPVRADGSFTRRFTDATNERYTIRGTLTTKGTAIGTLTSTWRTRRYGRCRTGRLHWRLSRS